MKLEEKLIFLRKQHGMSQAELAEELSTSRQTISKWENGAGLLSADNLRKISALFDVPMEVLADDRAELPIGPAAPEPSTPPEPPEGPAGEDKTPDVRGRAFLTFVKGVICGACILAAVIAICFTVRHWNEPKVEPMEELERDVIDISDSDRFSPNPLQP